MFEKLKTKFLALKRPLQIFLVGAALLLVLGMCSNAAAQEAGECEVTPFTAELAAEVCVLAEPVCAPASDYGSNWDNLAESIGGFGIFQTDVLGFYGPGQATTFALGDVEPGNVKVGDSAVTYVYYPHDGRVCLEGSSTYVANVSKTSL